MNQALNLVELRLVHDRANVLAFLAGVANLDALHNGLDELSGLSCLVLVHQYARGRNAALSGVGHDARYGRWQHFFELGTRQHDVGRLAAQLLMNTLDRISRSLGNHDAGAGRTGEAHHVDIGVAGNGGAYGRAIALDQIENTGGNAGCVHDFRQNGGVAWVLPPASAGATFRQIWFSGQFHGVIMPMTPIGS